MPVPVYPSDEPDRDEEAPDLEKPTMPLWRPPQGRRWTLPVG